MYLSPVWLISSSMQEKGDPFLLFEPFIEKRGPPERPALMTHRRAGQESKPDWQARLC